MSQTFAEAQLAKPRRIEWLLYSSAGNPASFKMRRSPGIRLCGWKDMKPALRYVDASVSFGGIALRGAQQAPAIENERISSDNSCTD